MDQGNLSEGLIKKENYLFNDYLLPTVLINPYPKAIMTKRRHCIFVLIL